HAAVLVHAGKTQLAMRHAMACDKFLKLCTPQRPAAAVADNIMPLRAVGPKHTQFGNPPALLPGASHFGRKLGAEIAIIACIDPIGGHPARSAVLRGGFN